MAKVKVWKRTDGGVSITYFDLSKKEQSETDEEFIERKSVKLREVPNLVGAQEFVMDSSKIPNDKANRNKWRLRPDNGAVIVDNTIILPEEARAQKLNAAKGKLIAGQPLTAEEAEELIK